MTDNYITKVAIVGAGGRSGRHITDALLKTGKHTVTALTRPDTQSQFPDGVTVTKVDYADPLTLTAALRGHDALIITLSIASPPETEAQLIRAAADAGVPWVLPNEWSPDSANDHLVKDVAAFAPKGKSRDLIASLGKSSYVSVVTGFWYEWSLPIPDAFGFDVANRSATFFDEGETKISISTWPQVGRAVAALLSLPVKKDGLLDFGTTLDKFRNQVVYVNSFTVSQKDILESAARVTGTDPSTWTIKKESAKERYTAALEAGQEGFIKMLYTRVFYNDGSGDYEKSKGTINDTLGLPKEDIDDATRRALERLDDPMA